MFVGLNDSETNRSQIIVFSLLTDEGMLNLDVKTSIDSPGLLGDLKTIVFFDNKSYLIAAINTQILFFEITVDGTL